MHLKTSAVERITETGIKLKGNYTEKEEHLEVDVIILATGFSILNSSTKSFKAKGSTGKIVQEEWKDQPSAFLGCAIVSLLSFNLKHKKTFTHLTSIIFQPEYPNLFYMLGPNTGLGHNTVI